MTAVVVGGGAAGFFAAIRAASSNPGYGVTLLEGTRRPLAKVRISGGGRCNVTHNCFDARTLAQNYPRGGKELLGPFSRFQPRDTVQWFQERGVELKAEADGRMFPVTDSSDTVIKCLETALQKSGATLRLGGIVRSIDRTPAGFALHLQTGEALEAKRLLLATGGAPQGYELARAFGHTIEPLVPSLFTFNIVDPRLDGLAGVAFPKATLTLRCDGDSQTFERENPLLITHWGLSGPGVLKLSAFGARALHASNYQADLKINFLPGMSSDAVLASLQRYKDEHPKRAVLGNVAVDVPRRFWERLVTLAGVSDNGVYADLTKRAAHSLATELTQGTYRVSGKGVFKEEFVTAGGVSRREVDFRTMESRLVPGLFFAGEILDVDGITGGFNFQNAWTTGWIAGASLTS